ncbi:adenine phosphoribosyltransferase [Thermovibrio ammonificans]|uniref:adenine phosphoribosyltransferase n=1 Tax=Thermovibrio ammonificans TaxID=228745 RepID=UPI00059CF865
MNQLKALIRDVPDFPKPGIVFKDITPLLGTPWAFQKVIDYMGNRYVGSGVEVVVGIESRGFILASALAYKLGAGLAIIRKPGKLPYKTVSASYTLEYGEDSIEIHEDAVRRGTKVVLVDDVLATGGTMSAAIDLVEKLGGDIVGVDFLIELTFLGGREKITSRGYPVFSLIKF